MAKCDALICGGFAFQYFERIFWGRMDADLEVVVGQGVDSELLIKYLENTAGYASTHQKDYVAPIPTIKV